MRRHRLLLALLALVIGLTGCATAAGVSELSPSARAPASGPRTVVSGVRAERPAYQQGARWIRSDRVYELIRIDPETYVFSAEGGHETRLSRDLVPIVFSGGMPVFQFTPTPRITWPLEVGKRGSQRGTFLSGSGDTYHAEFRWEVEAWEEVTVPAGKFKAFRLAFDILGSTNFGRGLTNFRPYRWVRLWYAPEIGQYVMGDSSTSALRFDLVAVDPAETEPLQIAIVTPSDQKVVGPDEETLLSGHVSGGKGVSSVAVTVNGEPIATETVTDSSKRTVVFKVPLPRLRDGKNVVLVTAVDPTGTSSQAARTVVYETPVAVSFPPAGSPLHLSRRHVTLRVPVGAAGSDCTVVAVVNERVEDGFSCHEARDGIGHLPLRLKPGPNLVRLRITSGGTQRVEERTFVVDPSPVADSQVEEQRVAEAQRQRAEAARLAEEQRKQAEAQRLAEADRKRVEEQRVAEAQRQRAEAARLAEEQRKQAEAQRLAEAERKRAEEQRLAEAQRQRAEAARLAEEQRKQAEAQRLAEEQRVAALPPLQIKLSSPSDQSRVENETIGLAGLVVGGKGISRVTVSVNGVDITRHAEPSPPRAMPLSVPVTLREGQNTLVVTAAETDGTLSQEVRTVYYEKPVPFTLAMRFPTDQMRVRESSTMAAAVVTSSRGIAKAIVTVNGIDVHQQSERTAPKSMLVTVPVALRPGVNAVAVSALEPDGTTRQEVRTVIYEPTVVTAAPVTPPPSKRERWAVVIGIGDYEHAGIPRLRYAVSDADAMYRTLIDVGGFKPENVLLLTDRSPRRPTLRNIKWALGTFLARSAHKDDTTLVFFAGHGAPEVDARGLERDGLAKYLIPIDADPEDLFSTALPMDDLQTVFSRIESDRLVAFLDSCYSGAAGGRTFTAKRSRAITVDDQFLDRLTRGKGRAIVTASRTSEVSLELDDLRHGLFTYYLVEGLKGAADRDRDGVVTLQEIYDYVEHHVTRKSRAVGGNQHPIMKGEVEGALPLIQIRSR
ncbi:MAG: caspase family protein [Candidatus Rokubacteria bacterium]|nr:caspase family protein [Candidatus Rokubacteria bacterium]